MGCNLPRTMCGIRSQKVAIFVGFVELVLHFYLLTWSVRYFTNYMEEETAKQNLLEEGSGSGSFLGGGVEEENRNSTSQEQEMEDEFEEFAKLFGEFFQTLKDMGFLLSFLLIIYEVYCLPAILILICSLCKKCKCLTLPWFAKIVFEILALLFCLSIIGTKILPFTYILTCHLVYEFLVAFIVMSGLAEETQVDLSNMHYRPPGDTELKLIGGHTQAHV